MRPRARAAVKLGHALRDVGGVFAIALLTHPLAPLVAFAAGVAVGRRAIR